MGEWLGMLAGGGMLALIAALVLTFLRQIGVLSAQQFRSVAVIGALTVFAGLSYLAFGALIHQVTQGDISSIASYSEYYRIPYLQQMYEHLRSPEYSGLFYGLFVYAGHALGVLLLGEYLSGGLLLAWLACWAGTCLLYFRLESFFVQASARQIAMTALLLPGSVFLFLPGSACLWYLLAAALFYFLTRKFKKRKLILPAWVFPMALPACAVCSAFIAAAVVTGQITF